MKTRIIRAGLAAAILVSSCTTNIDQSLNETGPSAEPVIATIGGETKTAIGQQTDGARKVHWSEGDQIIISTGINLSDNYYYTVDTPGSASAVFYPNNKQKTADFAGGAIAGYPIDNMFLGKPDAEAEIYFTIPEIQDYVPGSFAEQAMPMISDITHEPVLNFHNAAGVIKLKISGENPGLKISDISISTSQYICGECGYKPSTREIFFDETMLSSNEVVLRCTEGAELADGGTDFFIVVPHQTYTDMAITVNTIDGLQQTFNMKSGKEISIKRSTITEIPLVLNDLEILGDPEIKIKVTATTFESISIQVGMSHVTSYFCGFTTKKAFTRELESGELLSALEYMTPYTGSLSYSGSVSRLNDEFKDALIEPGQTYVIWFVPYKKTGLYTEKDLFYAEATTTSFTAGGTVAVEYSDLEIDYTSISMYLIAENAKYIYAILVPEDVLSEYETDQDKIDFLLEPGGSASRIDSSNDIFVRKFLSPGKRMVFMAIAIDRSGKYGPLLAEYMETLPLPYNELNVTIDKDLTALKENSTASWSVSGGTAAYYRYICRETSSYLWSNTLGASVIAAQEKMFLEPGLYYIDRSEEPSARLANLVSGKEYILVVAAVDGAGVSSAADSWIFTY